MVGMLEVSVSLTRQMHSDGKKRRFALLFSAVICGVELNRFAVASLR